MIRPPDEYISGPTLTFMRCSSADAIRRLLDLCYRDCWTVLDLTFGSGCFWTDQKPPGVSIVTNNPNPAIGAGLQLDFTNTGLADRSFDLVIYDPPHIADGGSTSIMARRFGTAKTTSALRTLVQVGAIEGLRLARLGLLVKVTDHSHGGELLPMSDWVKAVVGLRPYAVLHTVRRGPLIDSKWRVARAPRNNGATYLAFRTDSHRHRDWKREYERQERQR